MERGSRYILVQHHLATWSSLFLRHFFHERRQRYNLLDCPTGSEGSQFNVSRMIHFFENYCFDVLLSRPTVTLVLQVVLSCRLVLNLRSAAVETSDSGSMPMLEFPPLSDNFKIRTYSIPSSSMIIVGDQSRSKDLHVTSTLGEKMNLEPNSAQPDDIWNAQILYTNSNETL